MAEIAGVGGIKIGSSLTDEHVMHKLRKGLDIGVITSVTEAAKSLLQR